VVRRSAAKTSQKERLRGGREGDSPSGEGLAEYFTGISEKRGGEGKSRRSQRALNSDKTEKRDRGKKRGATREKSG